MGSGLRIELDIDDQRIKDHIQSMLDQSGKFKPVIIGAYSDHAFDVEFGSNGSKGHPYDPKGSYKARGMKSPVLMEIEKWVEFKFKYTGKHKENVANKIYHNLMNSGMPPQPFFRPAVHSVIRMIESDPSWFNRDGNDLMALGELMKEEMRRIIEENETIYTRDLIDKIDVRYAEEGEEDFSEPLARLPPGVLDSDWADLNGSEERAREARKRRRG